MQGVTNIVKPLMLHCGVGAGAAVSAAHSWGDAGASHTGCEQGCCGWHCGAGRCTSLLPSSADQPPLPCTLHVCGGAENRMLRCEGADSLEAHLFTVVLSVQGNRLQDLVVELQMALKPSAITQAALRLPAVGISLVHGVLHATTVIFLKYSALMGRRV